MILQILLPYLQKELQFALKKQSVPAELKAQLLEARKNL